MKPTVKPEAAARRRIDAALAASGWVVQSYADMNLSAPAGGAHRAIAVAEFPMAPGHGDAAYLLFLDGEAVGVLESQKEGSTLTGVEPRAARYDAGCIHAPTRREALEPLPRRPQAAPG